MTLSQLGVFVALAEENSFTATAARLGMTQSAVSHAIQALETELQLSLFVRNKQGATLTEAGHTVLQQAREMLALSSKMHQHAAAINGLNSGSLHIGSFGPTSSLRLLPALLQVYQRENPGIAIHIDEGPDTDVRQWLRERRVEVGFVALPDEQFETCLLTIDELVAVLPAHNPLAMQTSVTLQQLATYPFALTEAGSAPLIKALFQRAGVVPDIRYRTSQIMTTLNTVASGAAVAILAQLALPDTGWGLDYVARSLQPTVQRQVGLAWLKTDALSPAALGFIQLARRMAASGAL